MKKSELRKIIRENIEEMVGGKKYLSEQGPIQPNYQMLSQFASWAQQNNVTIDWRCMPTIRTWLATIFSLAPFNSTNPNQPCQFINNKINQLQTWIGNFTGNPNSIQLAQKQCKLQAFQAMLPWAQATFNC